MRKFKEKGFRDNISFIPFAVAALSLFTNDVRGSLSKCEDFICASFPNIIWSYLV